MTKRGEGQFGGGEKEKFCLVRCSRLLGKEEGDTKRLSKEMEVRRFGSSFTSA